jgi:hypothetical protein
MAAEILLSERQMAIHRNLPHSSVAPVNIQSGTEEFLDLFESKCSGRGKLSGRSQLACFYALLLFSIIKSILIDAYSIRNEYEDPHPWQEADAVRITSAYKALVSVFSWASKSDVVLANDVGQSDSHLQTAIRETGKMLHQEKWEEKGIKGSKDFLVSLGSGTFPDGAYNGFFVQKFGFSQLGKTLSKNMGMPTAGFEDELGVGKSTGLSRLRQPEDSRETRIESQAMSTNDSPAIRSTRFPDPQTRSVSNTKLNPKQATGWEHTVVHKGEISVLSESGEDAIGTSSGRKGKLNPETKAKAARLRQVKACWRCFISKVPVSYDWIALILIVYG